MVLQIKFKEDFILLYKANYDNNRPLSLILVFMIGKKLMKYRLMKNLQCICQLI